MTFFDMLPSADAAGRASLTLPADWAQGRATFGGLAAAALLRLMREQVEASRAPRSLLVSFAGPIAPGTAELETQVLRSGRSASFVEGRASQEGSARCLALGSFGANRQSPVTVPAGRRPGATAAEELPDLPYIPGITPAFTQHFAYRWTLGGLPFTSSERAELGGWCRLRNDDTPATPELVTALVDGWPAPVLPLLDGPAPASTVTWALDFVHVDANARASDWWYFESRAEAAGSGYAQCRASLWDPSGALAAVSRQTVAVFA